MNLPEKNKPFIPLGNFDTEIEVKLAYNLAAIILADAEGREVKKEELYCIEPDEMPDQETHNKIFERVYEALNLWFSFQRN